MKTRRLGVPVASLLLACIPSVSRSAAAEPPLPAPSPVVKTTASHPAAADLDAVWLPGMELGPAPAATPGSAQDTVRAKITELRGRLAAGDPAALDESRALAAEMRARAEAGDPSFRINRAADGAETAGVVIAEGGLHGAMTPAERRARLEELKARAAAGDPNVKVTITSTVDGTMSLDEARAKIAEMRARAEAGDPNVRITTRSSTTTSRPEVKMTDEERARRQAYVASHPDLPARTKDMLLAGYMVPAMKFEDVEQLLGLLKPVEGRLPNGELPYPDEKVYTAQYNGKTVYLYFREGKLLRR